MTEGGEGEGGGGCRVEARRRHGEGILDCVAGGERGVCHMESANINVPMAEFDVDVVQGEEEEAKGGGVVEKVGGLSLFNPPISLLQKSWSWAGGRRRWRGGPPRG